ncbi:MAG: helix-turn-helix transcriptional regulator [Ruminococcaceae bacterium]|nr:helix-turn-helix transcriptional regulator [Oscillospiraceae bacterium]
MKLYSERLRDLREDKDLKQKDLAEILETTQQVYSRYENGINELPIHHLITLSKFYNVSTDYILGLTDNPIQFK